MPGHQDNVELEESLRFDRDFQPSVMPRWQRKQNEANTNSATPKKTPSKTPRKGDRFIPSRSSMDMEISHFNITNSSDENAEPSTSSPSKENYTNALAEGMLDGKQSSRILSFSTKAPAPKDGYQNAMRVVYSQNKTVEKTKKPARNIPQAPDRILDAPELMDDYYLNLIDWNHNNILAVALGSAVYLWNASTGSIQQLMQTAEDNYVTSVQWAPEGNYLAIGTNNADVQLWDAEKTKQMRNMKGHLARVGSLAWNGHTLTSGSRDSMIFNHDVRIAQHHVSTLEGHTQEVCGLKWSPDGSQLASGGNDNLLHIWDVGMSAPKFTIDQHQAAVKALAWCPWQSHLLASGGGTADRTIKFWNTQTGALLNSIDTKSQVCSLVWSTHEKELLSSHGFSQNQLCLWKYPSMVKMAEMTGHTHRVLHLAASPDGCTVVSAAADETLRFWKVFGNPESKAAKAKDQVIQSFSRRTNIRGRTKQGVS